MFLARMRVHLRGVERCFTGIVFSVEHRLPRVIFSQCAHQECLLVDTSYYQSNDKLKLIGHFL